MKGRYMDLIKAGLGAKDTATAGGCYIVKGRISFSDIFLNKINLKPFNNVSLHIFIARRNKLFLNCITGSDMSTGDR